MTAVAFAVAAALGGVMRWQAARLNRPGAPFGTLAINVVAAFAAGLAADLSTTVGLIVTTALLGSLSTFSTLTGELVDLSDSYGPTRAIAYGTITTVAGISAATFAFAL